MNNRGFIDKHINHMNPINDQMNSQGGFNMLDLPRKKIENLGRLKPENLLEDEISDGTYRLLLNSQIFDKSKLPADPFKQRKDELIPIARLEAKVREHPINRDVGSSWGGVIQHKDTTGEREEMLQLLGDEILNNLFV